MKTVNIGSIRKIVREALEEMDRVPLHDGEHEEVRLSTGPEAIIDLNDGISICSMCAQELEPDSMMCMACGHDQALDTEDHMGSMSQGHHQSH